MAAPAVRKLPDQFPPLVLLWQQLTVLPLAAILASIASWECVLWH